MLNALVAGTLIIKGRKFRFNILDAYMKLHQNGTVS
jgi:hypothetical protein